MHLRFIDYAKVFDKNTPEGSVFTARLTRSIWKRMIQNLFWGQAACMRIHKNKKGRETKIQLLARFIQLL